MSDDFPGVVFCVPVLVDGPCAAATWTDCTPAQYAVECEIRLPAAEAVPVGPGGRIPVSSFLPDGIVLTPASDRFSVDEEIGCGIGHHPDATPEQRAKLIGLVRKNTAVFA